MRRGGGTDAESRGNDVPMVESEFLRERGGKVVFCVWYKRELGCSVQKVNCEMTRLAQGSVRSSTRRAPAN